MSPARSTSPAQPTSTFMRCTKGSCAACGPGGRLITDADVHVLDKSRTQINYHWDAVEPIPFDLEKAKELLEEADYDGTSIEIMVDTGNSTFRQIATMLQQGWQTGGPQ